MPQPLVHLHVSQHVLKWCGEVRAAKTYSSREIIAQLQVDGWYLVETRGSHHQYKHHARSGKVTVPHPRGNLGVNVVKSIFKQAGWQWGDRE